MENAFDIICCHRVDGVPLFFSPSSTRILGYTPEELLEIDALELFHKEDREDIAALFMPAKLPLPAIQARVRRKDGSIIWIEAHIKPVFSPEDEQIVEYVSVIRDITERKNIEMHLRQREEALLVFNEELLRATQNKERFLTHMSQALTAPLDAVLSVTETLLEGIYGPINEQQERCLATVIHSVGHQRSILNDILELSGLESGRVTLHQQKFPIIRLCQDSIQQTRELAVQRRIRLRFFMDAELDEIEADEKRLRQALIGLLRYALYLAEPGSEVHLEAELDLERQAVLLRVRETSPSFYIEDISRLFEPFVIQGQTRQRQPLGTGLELSLAKRLIALHQGSIVVDYDDSQGVTFSFGLPLQIASQSSPNLPIPEEVTPLPAQQEAPLILLAEDVETNIITLVDYLGAAGFHVEVARNGQEAVDGARYFMPALILMDIQMPVMDGLEAIKRIKSQSETVDIPIIALTALAMPGDRERCLQAGAVAYLSKPVSLSDLVLRIRRLIEPPPDAPSA